MKISKTFFSVCTLLFVQKMGDTGQNSSKTGHFHTNLAISSKIPYILRQFSVYVIVLLPALS